MTLLRPIRTRRRNRGPLVVAAPARPSELAVVADLTALGLATGLAELLVLLAQRLVAGASALGALQLNRHFTWMIPVSHLVIFAAMGVPLAILTAFAPAVGRGP